MRVLGWPPTTTNKVLTLIRPENLLLSFNIKQEWANLHNFGALFVRCGCGMLRVKEGRVGQCFVFVKSLFTVLIGEHII